MSVGTRVDPYLSFRFRVELDGLIVAYVSNITGLQVETETEPYEEGGVNDFVHALPKRTKYQNITLKRGITDLDDLWKWQQKTVSGKVQRKDGSIILIDSEGNDKLRWNFVDAYPVKWIGPTFDSDNATVAFESIEITHQGIKKG